MQLEPDISVFDSFNHQDSTVLRGSSILVDVHPAISLATERLAPISFPVLVRMNNPHGNHT
jgi:hypothetical protein